MRKRAGPAKFEFAEQPFDRRIRLLICRQHFRMPPFSASLEAAREVLEARSGNGKLRYSQKSREARLPLQKSSLTNDEESQFRVDLPAIDRGRVVKRWTLRDHRSCAGARRCRWAEAIPAGGRRGAVGAGVCPA